MESYSEYCKNFIINHVENQKGRNVYMSDLGSELTMGINVNGSATYSTFKAKEYLKEWWDEAGEYYEHEEKCFEFHKWNPFLNPEAFHCCMIIEGVDNLLFQVHIVSKRWNERVEIDDTLINQIIKAMKDPKLEIQF